MQPLPTDAGNILLPIARNAIARVLGLPEMPLVDRPSWLNMHGASFVTLIQADQRRARTGSIEAGKTLAADVSFNAVNAALKHPGSPPLQSGEFDAIAVEVAVLSNIERMATKYEQEVIARLRTGMDGASFRYGHHSSTFLPEAWAQYPTPADFLAHLKYRAGLPPDFWNSDIDLRRFAVTSWREPAG